MSDLGLFFTEVQSHEPCYFENPQQPHGSENTDAERGVGIIHCPDDFKQTTADNLQRQRFMHIKFLTNGLHNKL